MNLLGLYWNGVVCLVLKRMVGMECIINAAVEMILTVSWCSVC